MGFFSNLKNAVTGGAAQVDIHVEPNCDPGEEVDVTVRATAKSDLEIKRVYVQIHGIEEAEFIETEWEDGEMEREKEKGRQVSTRIELELSGSEKLAEGETYEWTGSFTLPSDAIPTIRGKIIRHSWRAMAGLDTFGNDPDSGWIEFPVG